MLEKLAGPPEKINYNMPVGDEVKTTTCYMCACRCGIKVHLLNGRVRYIEGNRDHPVNRGVLCAKGSAGIMQHYSPARLRKPLRRTGPRGAGEFHEIEWEEALTQATDWLSAIRESDPRRLAFFTGRDQSQSLTAWWASNFGTPNHAAHGGFCSVNMAAAGLYTIGGSFWEFGAPDWEHTRYFMLFGVAEDHDSNPIKIGLGQLKNRSETEFAAKIVSVNPVQTGYSAIADEWIPIRPGTDGAFVQALIHELLRAEQIDWDFLVRYTNAPWLVIQNPGSPDDGLFLRDADGNPQSWDYKQNCAVNALTPDIRPQLTGTIELGPNRKAVPVFQLLAERYLDPSQAPEKAASICGIPATQIRRIAAELAHAAFAQQITLPIAWTDWAGRHHKEMIGRPVSMHAMRGVSAHSNGFHTCRAIHLLQILLGSIDVPGGFRYKPPFPRPIPPEQKPAKPPYAANSPLNGPPLGFPQGPEDLLLADEEGTPMRIDKAYSWEAPLAAHGLMHMVITNAHAGDPYPIDTLFLYMANMSWNSTMNSTGVMAMLTDKDPETGAYKIPHIIYSDAYNSEMVAYADLILPDTTYLERYDCISLLDRPICEADGPADAIRQPILAPDRDVRPFQSVLLHLGYRLGLPGMTNEDGTEKYPGGYADYIVNHERQPGFGPLAGWRGTDGTKFGRGAVNPDQIKRYTENNCFWHHPLPEGQRYYKHANKAYLEFAVQMGFISKPYQIIMQLYSEPLQKFRLAARGHGAIQPPLRDRARIETYFDPLPFWYPPFEAEALTDASLYPLHAISQRPMAMYHSWGAQNAWLRQIHTANRLMVPQRTAEKLGIGDEDWVRLVSHHGSITAQACLMEGVQADTVWSWNAIGKRAGAWNLAPNAPESKKGFLLNHLISELLPQQDDGYRYANSDPVTGQAAWYDLRVRLERITDREEKSDPITSEPTFSVQKQPPGMPKSATILRYGAK